MKKIFILLLMQSLLVGCAELKVVNPPDYPSSAFSPKAVFTAPIAQKPVKFVAENANKQTSDNVTVEVKNILFASDSSEYSVAVVDPANDKLYNYNLFPMVLELRIINETDHIITLTKTIVKIEDDNQNDYPMVSSLEDSKKRLIDKISSAYDPYISDINKLAENKFEGDIMRVYSYIYNSFSHNLKGCVSCAPFRTIKWDNICKHITSSLICEVETAKFAKLRNDFSPHNPIIYRELRDNYFSQTSTFTAKATKLRENAIAKVRGIPDLRNLLTNGVYQPINVLPGRSEIVNIPFSPRKDGEQIKTLNIAVFDLPTKVDQAGNPTKRTHFKFKMVPIESN